MVLTIPPSPAHHPTDPVGATMADHDRRRHGRSGVKPALIPRLGGTAGSDDAISQDTVPAEKELVIERGNFARCLFFTVLLAVPSWGIVGGICYWMIH